MSHLGTCVALRCVVPDGSRGDRGDTFRQLLILLAHLMEINEIDSDNSGFRDGFLMLGQKRRTPSL